MGYIGKQINSWMPYLKRSYCKIVACCCIILLFVNYARFQWEILRMTKGRKDSHVGTGHMKVFLPPLPSPLRTPTPLDSIEATKSASPHNPAAPAPAAAPAPEAPALAPEAPAAAPAPAPEAPALAPALAPEAPKISPPIPTPAPLTPWQDLPWVSYISNNVDSQNWKRGREYDSRNVWLRDNQCVYASEKPVRPTEKFNEVISATCAKLTPEACTLFTKSFTDTFDKTSNWLKDNTVFLVTGDIPSMWLRDSTAQLTPYLHLTDHPSIQQLIEGTLQRQMKWLEMDPYGSAFRMYLDDNHKGMTSLNAEQLAQGKTVHVGQHDWELDSPSYVVRLAYLYWKAQPTRTCWMTHLRETLRRIVDLMKYEQNHLESTYTYPTLSHGGRGSPICHTGMIWAGMRPSDDNMVYHFNIPGNLFAAKALEYVAELAVLWEDQALIDDSTKMRTEILAAVKKYGMDANGVLAYEVDGCGKQLFGDDANIPSLLSLPYLGIDVSEYNYKATRELILSTRNPYYTHGSRVSGIGSDHYPYKGSQGRGHVWHLSLIMQGITGDDTLDTILATAERGALHESVNANGPGFTREWFGWANALYAEWMMRKSGIINA